MVAEALCWKVTPSPSYDGTKWCFMHPDVAVAAYSHVAVSFNTLVINLVIVIAKEKHPITDFEDTMLTTAIVAGSILGMLFFGWLADAATRKGALMASMILAFAGAAACALTPPNTSSLYTKLAVWRFVEGLGAGGVYPLSATIARESAGATPRTVATTICAQGVGYFLAPVVGWILLTCFSDRTMVWRLLLAIGAFLLLSALPLIFVRGRGGQLSLRRRDPLQSGSSVTLAEVLRRPQYWRLLAGTAGCWFVFDTVFYANTLFEDVVLDFLFPNADSAKDTAGEEVATYAVAVPGYFLAFALMDRLGPRYMQAQGFAIMALLYLLLASLYDVLGNHSPATLLLLYALTFFFSDFGPNCTTFIIPSLTYPPEHRAALNGVSAAAGKAGAVLGGLIFEPLANAIGVGGVFGCCSIFAALGALLTSGFIRRDLGVGAFQKDEGLGPAEDVGSLALEVNVSNGGGSGGNGNGSGGGGGAGGSGGGASRERRATSSTSELRLPILKGDSLAAATVETPAAKSGWSGFWRR